MKTTCEKCKGHGEVECCITQWAVPPDHREADSLLRIKMDAHRCVEAHSILCGMKPEHAESYDKMLADTLAELNKEAEGLDT